MDNKYYRLSEDHLHYGLEGKLIDRSLIAYFDLALFDMENPNSSAFPVSVDVTSGIDNCDGKYTFVNIPDALEMIGKMSGCKSFAIPASNDHKLILDTNKGQFIFHIQIKQS